MENLNYAGFWWRVLASFIDGIILGITDRILFLGIVLVMAPVVQSSGMHQFSGKMLIIVVSMPIVLLFNMLYFSLMESSPWQATLGKKACGLTITDTNGTRISFGRASARNWSKILFVLMSPAGLHIQTLMLMAGYIMAAFTKRKQALHDKIAKTLVLREVDKKDCPNPTSSQTLPENASS